MTMNKSGAASVRKQAEGVQTKFTQKTHLKKGVAMSSSRFVFLMLICVIVLNKKMR